MYTEQCTHAGLHSLYELSDTSVELLMLTTENADHLKQLGSNICFPHEQVLIERFRKLQRCCCDPFNKHPSKVTKSLRAISVERPQELLLVSGKHIKPGEKLYPMYRKYDI